jgi:putative addiction module killer protein
MPQRGVEPFAKWLKKLRDGNAVARVIQRLERLKDGNPGEYREVGQGVYELKIDYGPGYRLYCAFAGAHLVLLLCGGDKRKQKNDIEQAQEFWRDYRKRNRK